MDYIERQIHKKIFWPKLLFQDKINFQWKNDCTLSFHTLSTNKMNTIKAFLLTRISFGQLTKSLKIPCLQRFILPGRVI